MAEWISVKDRLPENCEFVFVALHNAVVIQAVYYARTKEFQLPNSLCYRAQGEGITHWMPIPDLPKGE